ncbi:riboflavin biosynthesis protein RibF [Lachnospiraceae bacterium]|nr:riboflavin biosynthesis protein RibF [Lachnospiraceae bacterium]
MQIVYGTTDFKLEGKSAVAIGKFDGIHQGHQKLLDCILEQGAYGLKSVVFTFEPPPSVLFGSAPNRELMTREEKRAAFLKMGIDVLIEFPLTFETAAMEPQDFIEKVLVHRLGASYIAAGTDVSFGAKGAGNYMLLRSMASFGGYELQLIDKVCYNGKEISSTYVREEVEKGNMEEVKVLLGTPYAINGIVMHGKRFGRTIGMPTVNLLPPGNKLLPPNGVYYSDVMMDGGYYRGITNIGYKPTVSEVGQMGVETYIYGFDEEIYGREITVRLLKFKRPERRFNGKEELREQMMKDVEEGRIFHREGCSGT